MSIFIISCDNSDNSSNVIVKIYGYAEYDYEHSRPLDVHKLSEIKVKVGTKSFTVCFTAYKLL